MELLSTLKSGLYHVSNLLSVTVDNLPSHWNLFINGSWISYGVMYSIVSGSSEQCEWVQDPIIWIFTLHLIFSWVYKSVYLHNRVIRHNKDISGFVYLFTNEWNLLLLSNCGCYNNSCISINLGMCFYSCLVSTYVILELHNKQYLFRLTYKHISAWKFPTVVVPFCIDSGVWGSHVYWLILNGLDIKKMGISIKYVVVYPGWFLFLY